MFDDISIEDYNEKSFTVNGETRQYKGSIKKLGGSWNPRIKAWIFPINKKEIVRAWQRKGEHIAEEEEHTQQKQYTNRDPTLAMIMAKLENIERLLLEKSDDVVIVSDDDDDEVIPKRLLGTRR